MNDLNTTIRPASRKILFPLSVARLISILCAVALAATYAGDALAQSRPQNLGFEDGELGGVPLGWKVPNPHYVAKLTREHAKSGMYCAELAPADDSNPGGFGNLMQTFDAGPYRGKRIRFRAAVRIDARMPVDRAQLWLRVDRQNGEVAVFDNMSDRPIREKEWHYYEILADVEDGASRISIGVILVGATKVWVDDASVDILNVSELEGAHPLTPRSLENEIAFARLFGVIRYFHPSDQAVRTDWDSLAIMGVREVENSKNDAELAGKLTSLFAPIAPTVRVLAAGGKYDLPPELVPSKGLGVPEITFWRHFGAGPNPGSSGKLAHVYHSDRVRQSAGGSDHSRVPTPGVPWRIELGAGVEAWVPIALYVDANGTLPHVQESPLILARDDFIARTAKDRSTRLADVIIAWNVFQHFYPYFDVVDTNWAAELPKSLQAAATDADSRAFNDTLQRLVAGLHDGHGAVRSKDFTATAVLPLQWDFIENEIIVTAVEPSLNGRIAPGDAVTKINGRPAAEALKERELLISGATPQWIRYRALQELARGQKGATIYLTIEPYSTPLRTTEVSVHYETRESQVQEHRPDKIEEIESGLYYVDVSRVSDADFEGALPQLERARGIVFDFRGYPYKLSPDFLTHLTQTELTSDQWLTPVVIWPDRTGIRFDRSGEWHLKPTKPFLSAKKAFITDGRAISYAESCLDVVQYYKLGEIVGGATAGTNGSADSFALPGGYSITWTGMKVLKQDGSRHHGVGVLPTIPVTRTRAGVAAGQDEFLDKALKLLRQ